MTTLRICFVGDSITNGTNDEEFRGWPGRLCETEKARGSDISHYNLGIRAETSEMIAARWRAECEPRLAFPHPGALVFSFGVNDMADFNEQGIRVPLERSVAVARDMMSEAKAWKPVLWVGPAPVDDSQQPFQSAPTISFNFSTARLMELDEHYADLASELDIPYLPVLKTLQANPEWQNSFIPGDGVHPTGKGYNLLAELVADWPAWKDWFAS